MPTDSHTTSLSHATLWAGGIFTCLVVLFLVFDAVTKIIKVTPVVEACEQVGIPPYMVLGIGVLLLACTTIYTIPRTAVLGGHPADWLPRRCCRDPRAGS